MSENQQADVAASANGEDRTIELQVNGELRRVPDGLTVRALLERLELTPETIVVERNREILDRGSYDDTVVQEGDLLELVHFVGGG